MAVINNCGIGSLDQWDLTRLIQNLARNAKGDRQTFQQLIIQQKEGLYQEDTVEDFVDQIFKGLLVNEKILNKKNLWISKTDLEAMFGGSNKPETEVIQGKEDELSGEERYFEDISDHFIDSVYGTSTAKDKMLRSFRRNIINSLFINLEDEKEIITNEECNQELIEYQERLFQDLKRGFKKELAEIKSLFDENGISNLPKINRLLADKKSDFNIRNLQKLSMSLLKSKFNAHNALFILNNFDRLLNRELPKLVTINRHEGVLSSKTDKYLFSFRNSRINNTWRDDDKDIDGTEEVSDVIRRILESINRIDINGNVISDSYLSFQEISVINTMIRALEHHYNANKKIGTTGKSLKDFLLDADEHPEDGLKKLFDILVSDDFIPNDYGIFPSQMATIKALHRGLFADTNSLYSIHLKTVAQIRSIDEQPSSYYKQVAGILNSQEAIDMQEYNRIQGIMSNITLKGQQEVTQTYSIDNTVGGIFNVNIPNQEFAHFGAVQITSASEIDNLTDDKIELSYSIDNYEDMVITRKHGGSILINGKPLSAYTQEQLNDLVVQYSDFFREVTRFVYDRPFIDLLAVKVPNYGEQLIKLASGIIYNYEVSKQLFNINDRTTYDNKLKKYFNEDELKKIKLQQGIKQLSFISDEFTSLKINLAKTRDEHNQVTRSNVQKDAKGKQISSIGLDQIATKTEQQWARSLKDPKAPIKNFSLLKLYRGQEFGRDFKSGSESKTATDFTEAENFIANFMFDYLGRIHPNEADKRSGLIKILPSVISDKSRIPKTLFDLNTPIPFRKKEDGSNVTYLDLDTQSWQELAVKELGGYYYDIYQDFSRNIKLANNVLKIAAANVRVENNSLYELIPELVLDHDNNFGQFNQLLQERIPDKGLRSDIINNLLHNIALLNQNKEYELIQNLHYTINRNGELIGNAALFDQLYRWGKIKKSHVAYKAYKLDTGYGTSEQFFQAKQYQYIEDLLKDNCEIGLFDKYGVAFKDKAYSDGVLGKDWKTADNIILAKIKYNYINDKGELTENALNITSKDELKQKFIYRAIQQDARFNPELYNKDAINIHSQSFSIEEFMKAIKIYNSRELDRKVYKAVKEALSDYKLDSKIVNILAKLVKEGLNDKTFTLDKSLKSIIGTIDGDATIYANITKAIKQAHKNIRASEFFKAGSQETSVVFEMNDNLAKYQATEFLLGQEYMNATLGTHLNHPGFGDNLKEIEAASWSAQVKRNVSLTASKYRFALDTITGIKSTYNVAIVEDDKDIVYNVFGRIDKAKPYDGATICSITSNYHENNSLGSNRAGIDKKQFIHDYKANSGSGIIVKTAGFPITNGRMRDSFMLQRLNKKMLDIPYTKNVRITHDYNGDILFGQPKDGTPINKFGPIVYSERDANGAEFIYRTVAVQYNNTQESIVDNSATIYRQVYNPATNEWQRAEPLVNVQLNSNYNIWKYVFGGQNSVNVNSEGKPIIKTNKDGKIIPEYNERSCEQLAYAMNYVGTKLVEGIATKQSDIDQHMKQQTIDYIITEGAIKQGAANVNSKRAYFEDDFRLTTMKLNMHDSGIQLNAEHHADNSTLSLMTQVLNALSARGYSMNEGNEVYAALRNLTKEALKGFDLGTIGISKGDSTDMQNFIADIILRSIRTVGSTDGNLIAALSSEIKKEYAEGNKVTYDLIRNNMPISMPAIFSKMVSQLASVLTQRCVRIKFPGSMNVLAPSNKIYKIYADHLLSYHGGSVDHLPNISLKDETGKLQVGEIKMGRTYLLSGDTFEATEVLIDDPRDYWRVRELVSQGIINNIEEVQKVGRDLATYGIRMTDTSGNIYNMWDLDSVKYLYQKEAEYRKIVETINQTGLTQDLENRLVEIALLVDYNGDIFDTKEFKNFLMRKLQETLNAVSKKQVVKLNGFDTQIVDMEVQPYELIASKVYETTFGLRQGDDVQDISNDKLFFVRRTLENLSKKVDSFNYDIELTVLNGKHVYLINSLSDIPSGLEEVSGVEYQYEGDELVQRDLSGKIIRKVSSKKDRIFIDQNGNEIIYTENPDFYVEHTDFVQIGLSENTDEDSLVDIFRKVSLIDKPGVKAMLGNFFKQEDAAEKLANMSVDEIEDLLETYKGQLKDLVMEGAIRQREALRQLEEELSKPNPNTELLRKTNKTVRNMIDKGLEIHTSFLQSLEFLAARIPAQSHQSFMAMKIVGFDESGKNTAYVSRMQIWLQGSDYDIDKVSLLGYKFKNGHFIKWSPYMNLSSKSLLEASKKLPFPNGKEVQLVEGTEEQQEELWNIYEICTKVDPNSIEYIEALNNTIRYINKLGFVPDIGEDADNILKIVNKHNKYFANKNTKDGLINFISTKMYSVSKDPVNLIQGQSPIDDMTKIIKNLGEAQPMHQKAKSFAPGSPQSKLSMLLLTLKGKENTGIVASAMKNFEACSQYYYKILNSGTLEQQQRLIMSAEIFGREIRMLANAYVADQNSLEEEVIDALNSVNNDVDAFLLFSAFLSLSTDNAKDPVLSKINAGPKMMSLYTAGLMIGFDVNTLVNIMTSPVAWEMSSLMNSNVFNDTQGIFNIDGIFDYLKNGPIQEYKALSNSLKKVVKAAVKLFYMRSRPSSKAKYESMELDNITDTMVIAALKNPRFNLSRYIKENFDNKEVNLEEVEKEVLDNYGKDLAGKKDYYDRKLNEIESLIAQKEVEGKSVKSLKKKEQQLRERRNDVVARLEAVTDLQKNTSFADADIRQEVEDYVMHAAAFQEQIGQIEVKDAYDFGAHDKVKMRKLLRAVAKYKSFASLAEYSEIVSPYDGQKYKVIQVIKKLSHIANEQARLRPILGLNQELPNDTASQFKFLRNFESIFSQRAQELGANNKAIKDFKDANGGTLEISFQKFIQDADYRDFIIKAYEPIKAAVNIFDVMTNSEHYLGYAEALNANIESISLASTSYRIANDVSKNVLNKYFKVARNGTLHDKYIKRVQKFIANRINNQFLLSQNIVLNVPNGMPVFDVNGKMIKYSKNAQIVLGTPHGNATFKYWMENYVIPTWQSELSANKFIKDLVKFNISNTFDGEGQVNYALTENMMPKSDYERAIFKQYKDDLNSLQGETLKGTTIPKLDLLFYYNLIAYNGESGQNSFTSLFEDIFAEKTNDTVRQYVEFYSVFDKEGSFELGRDFTEDELLQYIAPVENLEQGKLKYIRAYNPDTMRIEMFVLKDPDTPMSEIDEDNPLADEINSQVDFQSDLDDLVNPEDFRVSEMSFTDRVTTSRYNKLDGINEKPKYFTNNYYNIPERISLSGNISLNTRKGLFTISGKDFNYNQILTLAKANGHDITNIDSVIIKKPIMDANGEPTYIIDNKQTLSRINQLLEENC